MRNVQGGRNKKENPICVYYKVTLVSEFTAVLSAVLNQDDRLSESD